jgi:transposase
MLLPEAHRARVAAGRFGVAPSTAVRWAKSFRGTGDRKAVPHGGGDCSQALEVHADFLLALTNEREVITLAEISGHLKADKSAAIDPNTSSVYTRASEDFKTPNGTTCCIFSCVQVRVTTIVAKQSL